MFQIKKLITMDYNSHYHAYEIKRTASKEIIPMERLLIPYTETIITCHRKEFVMLKLYYRN